MNDTTQMVGLIPAAGRAKRLAGLPMSKELYPVGHHHTQQPKVVLDYLLDAFTAGGVRRCHIVIRAEKKDIPSYLKSGKQHNMHLSYNITEDPRGVPFTIDAAFPFIGQHIVAFGFPDILFTPKDAFRIMVSQITRDNDADIILGVFPVEDASKWDMVAFDRSGSVQDIIIKDPAAGLRYAWINAVWKPVFSEFMHDYVSARPKSVSGAHHELFIGEVIRAAVSQGIKVNAFPFDDGRCLDIGTFEGIKRITHFLQYL